MKIIVVFALLAAALAQAVYEDNGVEEAIATNAPDLAHEAPELAEDLASAVEHLKQLVPSELKRHTDVLATHVAFIQETKAKIAKASDKKKAMALVAKGFKSYKHNFSAARASIKAALSALTSDLTSGHNHDKRMLANAWNAAKSRVSNTKRRNKGRVTVFRHKACPTKRAEEAADRKKRAALAAVNAIKKKPICNVPTTWKAMGIKTATPKLGTAMYNKWTKNRADFVRKTAAWNAASAAHKRARRAHSQSMTGFKVALDLEIKNTHRSCVNTNKDYQRLNRDVQGNVAMRKQVFIATLIVGCYADNLSNNRSAQSCSNTKRKADTRRWNISPRALAKCDSRNALSKYLGPANWEPTYKNCKEHRRIQNTKEKQAKEKKAKLAQRMPKSFTSCGQTGRFGPSQSQCSRAYGNGVVSVKNGIQLYKIPKSGIYKFGVAGAKGGRHCGGLGGRGTRVIASAHLTAGTTLAIAVGQAGDPNQSCGDWGGGGGGGTFVMKRVTSGGYYVGALGFRVQPLIVAGGGAGMNDRRNSGRAQGGRGITGNYNTIARGGYSGAGGGVLKKGNTANAGDGFCTSKGPIGGGNNAHYGGFGGGGRPYNGGGGGGGWEGGACTIGGTDHDCYGGTSGLKGARNLGVSTNFNDGVGYVKVLSKP